MAELTYTITVVDTPTTDFFAKSNFDVSVSMSGTNTLNLDRYMGGEWRTAYQWTSATNGDGEVIVEVASGMRYRFEATIFDTADIDIAVRGDVEDYGL